MAKYSVVSYVVRIEADEKNMERVFLDAELINSGGNTKMYSYWMVDDTRAFIQSIYEDVQQGFDYAIKNFGKIEISEFEERIYLFFGFPSVSGKVNRQYTGKRIK